MGSYWLDVVLIGTLMLINGVFAGSEMALISLREGQLKALERRGTRRDHTVVRLARDPNRFLGTIQLGITLAGYLASATAAVTLARPVVSAFSFLGSAANAVAIAVVTFALTAVIPVRRWCARMNWTMRWVWSICATCSVSGPLLLTRRDVSSSCLTVCVSRTRYTASRPNTSSSPSSSTNEVELPGS